MPRNTLNDDSAHKFSAVCAMCGLPLTDPLVVTCPCKFSPGEPKPSAASLIAAELLAELEFIADQWGEEFDNDLPVNGADFVQWFAEIRPRILKLITRAKGTP